MIFKNGSGFNRVRSGYSRAGSGYNRLHSGFGRVRDITVWLSAINNLHINITGSHLKRVRHHVFIFNFYTNAY